jgi:hypothetical protein
MVIVVTLEPLHGRFISILYQIGPTNANSPSGGNRWVINRETFAWGPRSLPHKELHTKKQNKKSA